MGNCLLRRRPHVCNCIGHSVGSDLLYDNSSHFNECTRCAEQLNKTSHSLTVDSSSTNHLKTCACGYSEIGNHNYKYENLTENHKKYCTECSFTISEDHDLSIGHNYIVANRELWHNYNCIHCGYSDKGERVQVGYEKDKYSGTNGAPMYHTAYCVDCSTEGNLAYINNSYEKCELTEWFPYDKSDDNYKTGHWASCGYCGGVTVQDHKLTYTHLPYNTSHSCTCEICGVSFTEGCTYNPLDPSGECSYCKSKELDP